MGKIILHDAFWHPKLGLVLSYLYTYQGNVVRMPDGSEFDFSFVQRDNITFPKIDEVEAPGMVEFAQMLEDETP